MSTTVQPLDDYSYEPASAGGKYLRLKTKGQKLRIRIASRPIRFTKEFTDKETGAIEPKEQFAWVVIDKTEMKPTVRAFQGGMMIFLGIKKLATSEDWGDPTTYDLVIERTEEAGNYYTVTPIPKGMGPLTPEDIAMVELAALDLPTLFTEKPKTEGSAGEG